MITDSAEPMSIEEMRAEIAARRAARSARPTVTVAKSYESTAALRARTERMLGERMAGNDTRTHKEKHGRCEDAPCCGCCGGVETYY